jgi:hypothetical protein
VLRHHLKLGLIALGNQLFVVLSCFDILLEGLQFFLVVLLDLAYLIFPLVFLLEHLETGSLGELVHTVEFLGQLVELTEVTLLEDTHFLSDTLVIVYELVHRDERPVIRT